jgi:hypothetical protein
LIEELLNRSGRVLNDSETSSSENKLAISSSVKVVTGRVGIVTIDILKSKVTIRLTASISSFLETGRHSLSSVSFEVNTPSLVTFLDFFIEHADLLFLNNSFFFFVVLRSTVTIERRA